MKDSLRSSSGEETYHSAVGTTDCTGELLHSEDKFHFGHQVTHRIHID